MPVSSSPPYEMPVICLAVSVTGMHTASRERGRERRPSKALRARMPTAQGERDPSAARLVISWAHLARGANARFQQYEIERPVSGNRRGKPAFHHSGSVQYVRLRLKNSGG